MARVAAGWQPVLAVAGSYLLFMTPLLAIQLAILVYETGTLASCWLLIPVYALALLQRLPHRCCR